MSWNKRNYSQTELATSSVSLVSSQQKRRTAVPGKENSNFKEGSIVRIKLKQFLTYDAVEFKTGPFLNVIIGPNGTGKSAVVCAICLGLAGKTSWLGRASEPKDFIKYGADKANIEIELFNPYDESNYIFSRQISSNNTSHWWINGRTATLKLVEEQVARLNIQVGNLCQFLPQEKVADFARMTQQELLENTEKAVDRENMYENHQKLKAARQKARGLEQNVHNLAEQLDQEKQKNTRLEQDVRSYNDRQAFLKKVEILKMKKLWMEYEMFKQQYERGKGEKDRKSEELKQEQRRIAPIQKRHDQYKKQKQQLEKETEELSQKIRSKAKTMEDQNNQMMSHTDQIDEANRDFQSKVEEEAAREKKLNDLKNQLQALETGLAQLDNSDTAAIAEGLERVNSNLKEVSTKITSVQLKGDALRREIHSIKVEIKENEAQIRQIQDISNRRLETLRTLHQNTYDAVVWLRKNKHLFKRTVHEPMIICVNVKDPANAKLMETHISFNDLRSFICEDPADLDLLMKKMKNEQKLRINAIKAPDQPANSFKSRHPISHYKKYGFECYLQDIFTCPEPVMRYLRLMYKVHNIPVGSRAVQKNTELIKKECPEVTSFYTPDVQYTIKRSKYTSQTSSRNSALREPRALVDSVNAEREQELTRVKEESIQKQKAKEDEYKALQKQSEELELKINGFREEKRNLMKQKDQRKHLENQITTKRQRIEQVSREKVNIPVEREKLQNQLKKIVTDKCERLHKMKEVSQECVDIAKNRATKSLSLAECGRHFSTLDAELLNARQRCEGLEREVANLKEHVAALKQQARQKLVEARNVAGIGMNDELEATLKERNEWEEFDRAPSSTDELDSEIHSMQARAEAMFPVDEQVVNEFKQREQTIQEMERILQERETHQQNHQEDISQTKRKWLEPLNTLIQEINQSFSHFFSCMNCCGEVSLYEPENLEDYEKYGVCIKVKFRDDETLRELTAQHQSGGERSVSTVLYMMALQELTKCPFRSVDEINQGMDPKNERKIFELVVKTVCRKRPSQYFLLTPKLLPDLEYDKNMTVLCIYNGEHMMNHTDWNLGTFLRKRAAYAN